MATCSDLIKGAFRRAGISRDLDEVRPRELERGMQVLHDVYLELLGAGAFGRLNDVAVSEDYEAQEQDRVLVTDEDAITITIGETVVDPIDGLRPPRDGSVVVITDVATTARLLYIYDAAFASWVDIAALTLTDEAPLTVRYRAGLEARLAVRLSEENGMAVTPELRRQEAMGMSSLLHRFDAPERATQPDYF